MPKVAPSQRVREEITRVLKDGLDGEADVTSTLLRLGAQRLAQELLEEEVTDFLGRERYVRHRGGQPHRGYRNGYEPGRVRTAEGQIPLLPQVRAAPEPFQSRLLSFLRGHTDVLQRLVAEMYARGLSTRDIEDAFRDVTGQGLINASAVSELTNRLWQDYEAFSQRDLSGFGGVPVPGRDLRVAAPAGRDGGGTAVRLGDPCGWPQGAAAISPWATRRATRAGWRCCGTWCGVGCARR